MTHPLQQTGLVLFTTVVCASAVACFSPDPPGSGETSDSSGAADSTGAPDPTGASTGPTGTLPTATTSVTTTTTAESTATSTSGDGMTGSSSEGQCDTEGCPCNEEEDSCGGGLLCHQGACYDSTCGDGFVLGTEECEDGNKADGDGCDSDCSFTEIELHVGGEHSCVLIEGGRVRCWGGNARGQLGYGFTQPVGDDEHPWERGDLTLGFEADQVALGRDFSCAVSSEGGLRCWGENEFNQLGHIGVPQIGDNELPTQFGLVDVGASVASLGLDTDFSCAVTDGATLRCWGGEDLPLGYGQPHQELADQTPAENGDVPVGTGVSQVATYDRQICVVQLDGNVLCWGESAEATQQLAQSAQANTLTPFTPPEPVADIQSGLRMQCTLSETGNVRCWGRNIDGQLGYGTTEPIPGNELKTLSAQLPVDLPEVITAISVRYQHVCAVGESGGLYCWGRNERGELGIGSNESIGNDPGEAPATVETGGVVRQVGVGYDHTCVVMDDNTVRCWGANDLAQLGSGPGSLPDDVLSAEDAVPVQIFEPT